MSRPPVTYPVSLADIELFADAACELDVYNIQGEPGATKDD